MKVRKVHLSPMGIFSRLRFYQKSQYWDRDTIERYQLRKVREMIVHAGEHVPYYRQLFRSAGFDPGKFRCLKDLEHIPLLDKEHIRKDPMQFVADHRKTIHGYWKYTTGSTGTPLKFFLDRNCHINKYAATIRAYQWAGYKPGKRSFLLMESENLSSAFGYRLLSNSVYFNTSAVSRENVRSFYPLLNRFRPIHYMGYGRAFLHLYKQLADLRLPVPSPVSIVNYGENLTDSDRLKLESVYRTKVYNFYSHREDTVMAAETEPGNNYLMEDFFYPEILDGSNRPVEEGTGELIGTGFYNYTMPLIRYKTTDIVTVESYATAHPRKFTRLKHLVGRVNDKVVTPGGREFYFMGEPIFDVPGIVSAQHIQERIDSLRVNLLTDASFDPASMGQIRQNYLAYLGEPMTLDLQVVEQLEERGTGKRPVIISRLNN